MSLIETLKWRYATKRMNGTKVSQEKIDNILEAIRLTPTSYGMQAFKVYVIESHELRQQIYEKACKQNQILEASHLLVFAANVKITNEIADNYISLIAKERNVSLESLADFRSGMQGFINDSAEKNFIWTARQTYIALGIALTEAATQKIDATPMEGFNPLVLDEILDLKTQNVSSVSLLALGYRDEKTDYLVNAKKVRKATSDLFVFVA